MRKTAAQLVPGESVHDEAQPQRARFVHSVEETMPGREWRVRFGHPDGDPESPEFDEAGNDLGVVDADHWYEIIADANGNRPTQGDLPTTAGLIRSIVEDDNGGLPAEERLRRILDVLDDIGQQ